MSNEFIAAIITVGILGTMFLWSLVCDRACDGRHRSSWKPSQAHDDKPLVSPVHEQRSRYSA